MCNKCNEMRQGESWDNFLNRYKIKNICDENGGWRIESSSGGVYHVKSKPFIDDMGSMGFKMSCDCPARGRCRHIDAVQTMIHAEAIAADDVDCVEILERTI